MTSEEIQVGEYVRTKDGYISKVKEVTDDWIECESVITKHYEDTFDSLYPGEFDTITKHSFNIIDLIEVGDYVNGYRVTCGHYTFNNEIEMIELDTENAGSGYGYQLSAKDIQTIVTKEQFKALEYKVGGEND